MLSLMYLRIISKLTVLYWLVYLIGFNYSRLYLLIFDNSRLLPLLSRMWHKPIHHCRLLVRFLLTSLIRLVHFDFVQPKPEECVVLVALLQVRDVCLLSEAKSFHRSFPSYSADTYTRQKSYRSL